MGKTAEMLAWATRLTREGRLAEATRVIQEALGQGEQRQPAREADDVIGVPSRVVPDAPPADASQVQTAGPHVPRARPASFTAHVFPHEGHRWRYRLYEPERADPAALLPVVVMLHGCKQDSEDFARGTGMNEVAAREGFLVLYPEQLRKSNQMGCWNWFEPGHQRRGAGEPGMLATMVQAVVAQHGGDPDRVYVAGLSAGGAMAAVLGESYPELFAAVGIHSGLPPQAARDVTSAFTAMRKGAGPRVPMARAFLPTIVFHGTADKTVAPSNGEMVVQRQVAAASSRGMALERREERVIEGRTATRTTWVDESGKPVVESWKVAAGPHAWSGGDAAGSFTDPQGPSASRAMAAFLVRHRRGG